jgi:hypothetical protein
VSFVASHRWAALRLRVRVFFRRHTLDRLLAAGSDPSWDPELGLRAAQLTAAPRRRELARSLERTLSDAHGRPRWSCAAPLDRGAVRLAAPELRTLAVGLSEAAAPAPQGIALGEQLLRDPDSPLYAPGDAEALQAAARIACDALGDRIAAIHEGRDRDSE